MSKVSAKFAQMRKDMNQSLIERSEEIDLALTALIAQQHLLLVGPPGTAKSLVADTIREWITGAKRFVVHCCKDTTRNVAFGPIKLSAMREDRTERALTGGAADSHILILEEVFKAGPAVLDMFLLLMNERIYREGLVTTNSPLRFLLGVSNEWSPEGCEAALAAFFDRFLFRKGVIPIRSKKGIKDLVQLPANGKMTRGHTPKLSTQITLEELDQAHIEAKALKFSPHTEEAFFAIHNGLGEEGIVPGDRRLFLSVTAIQAYAYLCGAVVVEPEHLEVLAHVLWEDPLEGPKAAAKVVGKIANPVGIAVTGIRSKIEDILEKMPPAEAVPKLQACQKELASLKADPRRDLALDYVEDCIKTTYNRVIRGHIE